MQILVIADEATIAAFKNKHINKEVNVQFAGSLAVPAIMPDALFFLLSEHEMLVGLDELKQYDCPVIINSVVQTLEGLPTNFVRINAWPGFLERDIMEVVAHQHSMEVIAFLFKSLDWQYELVPDIPGMIAARIIASIINEAFFALGDDVSTRQEMDIAMKLGTNYPYGPFKWAEKIGYENIVGLLHELAVEDKRYTPAPLLLKEIDTPWQ